VIAKGEAQGMVSKAIGIMLGIALANCTRSSTSLALASFGVVTWIHMFCNLKSYHSIQLRTLNPYRASTSLLLSFYFLYHKIQAINLKSTRKITLYSVFCVLNCSVDSFTWEWPIILASIDRMSVQEDLLHNHFYCWKVHLRSSSKFLSWMM